MGEEKSKLGALIGSNVREIIREANKLGIKKDNIITLLYDGSQYILIYESINE